MDSLSSGFSFIFNYYPRAPRTQVSPDLELRNLVSMPYTYFKTKDEQTKKSASVNHGKEADSPIPVSKVWEDIHHDHRLLLLPEYSLYYQIFRIPPLFLTFFFFSCDA